jgi:hypothetical protein
MYSVRQYQNRHCLARERRCCGIGKKTGCAFFLAHSQSSKLVVRRLSVFFTSPIPEVGRCFAFHGEAYCIPVVPYFRRQVPVRNPAGNDDPSRALVRGRFVAAYSCPYPYRLADRASVRIRPPLVQYRRDGICSNRSLPQTAASEGQQVGNVGDLVGSVWFA